MDLDYKYISLLLGSSKLNLTNMDLDPVALDAPLPLVPVKSNQYRFRLQVNQCSVHYQCSRLNLTNMDSVPL